MNTDEIILSGLEDILSRIKDYSILVMEGIGAPLKLGLCYYSNFCGLGIQKVVEEYLRKNMPHDYTLDDGITPGIWGWEPGLVEPRV